MTRHKKGTARLSNSMLPSRDLTKWRLHKLKSKCFPIEETYRPADTTVIWAHYTEFYHRDLSVESSNASAFRHTNSWLSTSSRAPPRSEKMASLTDVKSGGSPPSAGTGVTSHHRRRSSSTNYATATMRVSVSDIVNSHVRLPFLLPKYDISTTTVYEVTFEAPP